MFVDTFLIFKLPRKILGKNIMKIIESMS